MKLRIGLLIVCLVMSVSLGLLLSNSGSSGSETAAREGKIRIGFSMDEVRGVRWHKDRDSLKKRAAELGCEANWVTLTQERPLDKPFFFWFASNDAHRSWDNQWERAYGPKTRAEDAVAPPFLMDPLGTHEDLASYYNEITRFV
jgi:hypothetical protein|tara:strand:+ start:2202 stop:2633 length:432 start_codon:yes stop_codon:yes gene_type:complete